MRPPCPEDEDVVSDGKLVSGKDSADVVRAGKLVSVGASEVVLVSLGVVEGSLVVSVLLDVLDGAPVEVADEDLPSAEVSDKSGKSGACASTVAMNRIVIRKKRFMGARFTFRGRRIAGLKKTSICYLQEWTL